MNAQFINVFTNEGLEFQTKYPQFRQKTNNIPIQASCPFYVITSCHSYRQQSDEKKYLFQLCISGQWILQRQVGNKAIISSFRCGYDKSYQILTRYQNFDSQQKKLEGLRFIFCQQPKTSLNLFVKEINSSQLQYFTKILQTKTIFQVGFFQHFKTIRRLGFGTTSIVYSVLKLSDNNNYAVKCSKKRTHCESNNQDSKNYFINEISIWSKLNHRNIGKLYSTYQSQNSIYMVTQLLPMTLLDFIKRYGFPKKNVSKKIIRELFTAIQYLHENGIMHRDIKLENIMIKKDDLLKGQITPVLVDFGLAHQLNKNQSNFVKCGTPSYTAPQILSLHPDETQIKYSQVCDIFSLGVVAFILLIKKNPFQGQSLIEIIQKNQLCEICFEDIRKSNKIESVQIDFLERILKKDPGVRLNAKQALEHSYLSVEASSIKQAQTTNQFISNE